jgi:peptidoglycan/LPS O-acetylase OafA/YrhL
MTSAPTTPWRGHLRPLDGLRGLAVLVVMLLHFTTAMTPPAGSAAAEVRGIFQLGWIGVDLFFVLSGFLITGILADNRGSDRYFSAFYARRALRILPVYVAALVVVFHLVPLVFAEHQGTTRGTELSFWLFVANFRHLPYDVARLVGHYWSLAIEEQFYLLWPLVVYFASRRAARGIVLATIVVEPALRFAALRMGVGGGAIYHYTPFRLDGLAMGAFVALELREEGGVERLRRWWRPAASVGFLAFVVYVLPIALPHPVSGELRLALTFSAVSVLFGALLTGVVLSREGRARRALGHPALVTLGSYSYAMYLLHVPLMRAIAAAGLSQTWALGQRAPLMWVVAYPAAMILLSLLAAMAVWYGYERHFLAFKHRFPYASEGSLPRRRLAIDRLTPGGPGVPAVR